MIRGQEEKEEVEEDAEAKANQEMLPHNISQHLTTCSEIRYGRYG
jgi:hypothetical protein